MSGLRSSLVVALSVVVVLSGLALGVLLPPAGPIVTTALAGAPTAGGSACVVGASENSPVVELVLAAPEFVADGDAVARGLSLVEQPLADAADRRTIGNVVAGDHRLLQPELGADGWLWNGWADLPLIAWREWRSAGAPGVPAGIIAGECGSGFGSRQTLLGMRTDGGHEAFLEVANPFPADATFAVTFVTPAGAVAPLALRNISVRSGTRTSVRVNDHMPEESDLVAVVEVGVGRVAVEGLQRSLAGVEGIGGLALVPVSEEPSTTPALPWLVAGPATEGTLWLYNPSSRRVEVSLAVHTGTGAQVPEFLPEIELAAGELLALDAADLAPAADVPFAVTLRSRPDAINAAMAVRYSDEDVARTGIVVMTAAERGDRRWLVAGRTDVARVTRLQVVNLEDVEQQVQIRLTLRPADSEATIEIEVGALTLPAGAVRSVLLPLPVGDGEPASWVAEAVGQGALVVARIADGGIRRDPVGSLATPSRRWLEPLTALRARDAQGWVGRLRTGADLRRTALGPDGSGAAQAGRLFDITG